MSGILTLRKMGKLYQKAITFEDKEKREKLEIILDKFDDMLTAANPNDEDYKEIRNNCIDEIMMNIYPRYEK